MAASVGTDEATSHEPNPIVEAVAAGDLGAERVRGHGREPEADDSVRLAMPENIRKRPRRSPALDSRLGAPAASATESTSGYSTPERAVLLGKAGAMTPSTRKML